MAVVAVKPSIEVVAAILTDAEGRVLLAQRPPGKLLAGYWEFPGGKLEPGEGAEAALRRELAEELGIQVLACSDWLTLNHEYPERHVLLRVWRVQAHAGVPVGREGQALQWLAPRALAAVGLLPADLPIAARLVAEAN
jgi:8-oxo-dGTP diphosphatase